VMQSHSFSVRISIQRLPACQPARGQTRRRSTRPLPTRRIYTGGMTRITMRRSRMTRPEPGSGTHMAKQVITSDKLYPVYGPYSHAVRVGDLVFLHGTVGFDAQGRLPGETLGRAD